MKGFISACFTLVLLCAMVKAQVPQSFSYQAIARDTNGNCLPGQLISLQLSIIEDTTTNLAIYKELFSDVSTNDVGHFQILLGTGLIPGGSPNFAELDWNINAQSRYLKVELSPDNNQTFQEVGMTQLWSVPYAKAAGNGLMISQNHEYLSWRGANGNRNGLLGGGSDGNGDLNLGLIELHDENGDARIVMQSLNEQGGAGSFTSKGANGSKNIKLSVAGTSNNHGALTIHNDVGDSTVWLRSAGDYNGAGNVYTFGPNGELNCAFSFETSSIGQNRGQIRAYDENGSVQSALGIDANGSGFVSGKGPNGSQNFKLSVAGAFNDHGELTIHDEMGDSAVWLRSAGDYNGAGNVYTFGPNGELNCAFSFETSTIGQNRGQIRAYDENGSVQSALGIDANGSGFVSGKGPNGSQNFKLSVAGAFNDHGELTIHDEMGDSAVWLRSAGDYNGAGNVYTFGPNGKLNCAFSFETSTIGQNRGQIRAYDENGAIQAEMGVDANGDGFVAADIKNFTMPDPRDHNKKIWYASLEGPEAAAYERGTVTLANGEAEVHFTGHFEIVINPNTMTVMTSPWSADSKGLAVTERTAKGFRIKELNGGTGNYQVDWEAKAVRKGWEDYQVIRDKEPNPDPRTTKEN